MASAVVTPTTASRFTRRPASARASRARLLRASGVAGTPLAAPSASPPASAIRSWTRRWRVRPAGAASLAPLRPVTAAQCAAGRFSADRNNRVANDRSPSGGGGARSGARNVHATFTPRASTANASNAPDDDSDFDADARGYALPRVPVTITNGQRAFALWTCLAIAAAAFSVPFGFVRWNLSTIAPLIWWKMGLSTAIGTTLALPYLLAVAAPAATHRAGFAALLRAAFGVRGAALPSLARGLLGLALTAFATLIGGEATYGLWGEVMYLYFDGAPLPAEARFGAYFAFWALQLATTAGKSAGKKVLALGRTAAVVAAAYLAWSWNAGDAAVVFDATMSTMPALSEGLAAFVPELGAEFWKHAATVAGVWMTLGSIVPDYAQRMTDAGEVAKGQILLLPALSAAAALVASSLAQAPNVALYGVVAVAALVTNAVVNVVGPTAALTGNGDGGMSPRAAAVVVALAAAAAAPLVLTWQQVVAASSWAVGVGSLLVAPAVAVAVADYWVMRDRVIDRDALGSSPDSEGAYAYLKGVNWRAIVAFIAGAAPDVVSLAPEILGAFAGKGADVFYSAYVVNMEYSSLYSVAYAFVTYVLLSTIFMPDSVKMAKAEARERENRRGVGKEGAAASKPPPLRTRVPVIPPSQPGEPRTAAEEEELQSYVADTVSTADRVAGAVAKGPSSKSAADDDASAPSSTPPLADVPVVINKNTVKNNFYVAQEIERMTRKMPLPDPDDDEEIDFDVVKRFYDDLEARIGDALAPARATQRDALDAIAALAAEQRSMLEGHVADGGGMSMAEVRYEVFKMKQLVAEAETAAAVVAKELSEAWAFFEQEGAEDVGEIEARLESERASRNLALERRSVQVVYKLVDERKQREADARRAATEQARELRESAAKKRDVDAAAAKATDELRAEDESRSFIRNWALAVDTWIVPPILEVPMLPMSEQEAAKRAEEDARRSQYEFNARQVAEEESRRRAEEDERRQSAESDLRRQTMDEERQIGQEEVRRKAAADEIQRLRMMVLESTEGLESAQSGAGKRSSMRMIEEETNVERENMRRDSMQVEIQRLVDDIAVMEEKEEQRRTEFDARLESMANEEQARRDEEAAKRVDFKADAERAEEEEMKLRAEEEKLRDAARNELDAANAALAAVVEETESRRADALMNIRKLMDEEAQTRAEENARRGDAENSLAMAAIDERARLLAEEDARRAVENARRADAADAAGDRARSEQANIETEEMRRQDADDAVRAAGAELEDLEREIAQRRSGFALDAEARKIAFKALEDDEARRRAFAEEAMAAAAEAEARRVPSHHTGSHTTALAW
jgi:cytosine/uracil/thiamine/allantoin permease